MKTAYWGYHLILDCAGCDPAAIRNHQTVHDFTKRLVKDIDMVAYGEPQIVDFGSGDKAGFTLVQLIETSNICAHFVNELNEMYLDVFSCKPFDTKIVIELVRECFKPDTVKDTFLHRRA
jgi:S-adenosylmethionine/arginine decarboxylase-like enzyme